VLCDGVTVLGDAVNLLCYDVTVVRGAVPLRGAARVLRNADTVLCHAVMVL
jgi:hypothetical protein